MANRKNCKVCKVCKVYPPEPYSLQQAPNGGRGRAAPRKWSGGPFQPRTGGAPGACSRWKPTSRFAKSRAIARLRVGDATLVGGNLSLPNPKEVCGMWCRCKIASPSHQRCSAYCWHASGVTGRSPSRRLQAITCRSKGDRAFIGLTPRHRRDGRSPPCGLDSARVDGCKAEGRDRPGAGA